MAIWSALRTAIVGVGAAEATADAMAPILTPAAQDAWAKNPYKALAASVAADLVSQGLTTADAAQGEASLTGINPQRLTALVEAVLTAPGIPEALTLWRREYIGQDDYVHALRKSRLEPQWDTAMEGLKDAWLTPEQIALGIVRSVVADPGLLAVTLDTSDSNVPKYPIYPGDTLREAAGAGISEDRLRVMVGEIGLPMAAIAAAQASFRGIITKGAYYQAILEGDVRPEWADPYYEYARQIPTAHDFIEMRLRNYFTTDDELYAGTARHGMSPADTDVLFNVTGRPLGWHQTWIGLRRGGTLGPPSDDIDPAFLDSLRKSNIRPEYYDLAWAQRFTLPSVFMVRQWLKDGGDTTRAHDWLYQEGWNEDDIQAIIKEYSGKPAGTSKTLTRAEVKAAWKVGTLSPDETLARLEAEGLSVTDANLLFNTWKETRDKTSETA